MPVENVKNVRVLISGRFGNSNLGDDAILLGMVQAIKEYMPGAHIIALADNPSFVEEHYGIPAFPQWPPGLHRRFTDFLTVTFWRYVVRLLKLLRGVDVFVLGGGGFLGGGYEGRSRFGVVPYWFSRMFLAQLLGKPTVMYALGVGVIHRGLDRFLLRAIGNRARFITVRDEESKANLIAASVKPALVTVTADASLRFADSIRGEYETNRYAREFRKIRDTEHRSLVGIVLSPLWRSNGETQDGLTSRQARFNRVLARAVDLLAKDSRIQTVVFATKYEEDKGMGLVLQDIRAGIGDKRSFHVIGGSFTPYDAWAVISELDVLVSMKLHPLILSALSGTPFVGIVNHSKIHQFLSMVGMQDYALQVEPLGSDELAGRVRCAIENGPSIRRVLADRIKPLQTLTDRNAVMLSELLESGRQTNG